MKDAVSEVTYNCSVALFCYSHMCRTTSVIVDPTYAGFIVISFPYMDVELMVGKAEGLVWVSAVTRQGDYNCKMPSGRNR
jgi:hypothetical protein